MKRVIEIIQIIIFGFILGAIAYGVLTAPPKERDEIIDQLMLLGD